MYIFIYKLLIKYIVILIKLVFKLYSQFVVVVIEDNIVILVIFKMKYNLLLKIEGKKFYNGDVFNFFFDCFEIYQIEYKVDLIGMFIELLVFIVIFLGNDCNEFEYIGVCDYFVEQLLLISSVDKIYIVFLNLDDRDIFICIIVIQNMYFLYMIGGDI